ncbi:MAG: AAA-like domain-containing protein [Blastocatellia bacterium]|nr:AAA-like domain-containing protein [Blastocatellia bacterium]
MSVSASRIPSEFYVVGGTMEPSAPSYIERQADNDLFAALRRGEYCYVLTARQMGKSSLMIRTAARLRESGARVAVLDLAAIGQNLTPERWYAGQLVQIGQRLGLKRELLDSWSANPEMGAMQRWVTALREVLLARSAEPLIIFIDEIDAVRSLRFPTDEYFAGIRECHNLRSEDAAMQRVTFCLLGVATPADLIQDPRTTPFNIGRRIELQDFTPEEASGLVFGLGPNRGRAALLLRRVLHWTGGHPYLTQRFCQALAKIEDASRQTDVDRLSEELFITPRAQELEANLLFVRDQLLRDDTDRTALLELYSRVRSGRMVPDDGNDPRVGLLRLSGVTRAENGRLRVRNRIYHRVFDRKWVASNLPDAEARRQRAALWRGVWRTTAVALLLLLVVGGLAWTAFKQRNRAEAETYLAKIKLASQEWENANVDRVEELLRDSADALRNLEWEWLWNLSHGEAHRFPEGHQIAGVAFSGNGRHFALAKRVHGERIGADEKYQIRRFANRSWERVGEFSIPAGGNFDLVAFSPDHRLLMADGSNFDVQIFDLIQGKPLARFHGHEKALTSLAFSSDGRRAVTGSLDATVRIWDVATGAELRKLQMPESARPRAAFSPDGRLLVITSESATARIVEVQSGREQPGVELPHGELTRALFFPDGKRIVTAARNGALHFWDVATRRIIALPIGHTAEVFCMSFSRDGRTLATGGADRTVKLWQTESGRELRTIRGHGSGVQAIDWNEEGTQLATGSQDGTVKIWEVPGSDAPGSDAARYLAAAFTPQRDLRALLVTGKADVKVLNATTRQTVRLSPLNGSQVLVAAFSRDGGQVATAGTDSRIDIWDAVTGTHLHALIGHQSNIFSADFSPDGRLLVSGGQDKTIRLWDLRTGREWGRLEGGEENYYRAVFSHDGRSIASACRNGNVKLWDVETRTLLKVLSGGHTDRVRAIAFSRDDRMLATGSMNHTILLWDLASGKKEQLGRADSIQRAAFTADGKRLVTGAMDGTVKLWDLATKQELLTLKEHTDQVSSVTFSADGVDLATCSADGTLRHWMARSSRKERLNAQLAGSK